MFKDCILQAMSLKENAVASKVVCKVMDSGGMLKGCNIIRQCNTEKM